MTNWTENLWRRSTSGASRASSWKEHGYEKAISVAAERAVDLGFKGKERGGLVKAVVECIREWHRERGAEDAVN